MSNKRPKGHSNPVFLNKSPFEYCILDCGRLTDSYEHLFPKSIGGNFEYPMLCKECNNGLGGKLVSQMKADPSIRLAMENLLGKLPNWTTDTFDYFTKAPTGENVLVKRYKGRAALEVATTKLKDGSILQSDREDKYPDKPFNVPFLVPKGNTVIKRKIGQIFPDLSAGSMDFAFAAMASYEMLALSIGLAVMEPQYDALRGYILGKATDKVHVTRWLTVHAEPNHFLRIEKGDEKVTVILGLFKCVVFETEVLDVKYVGRECLIVQHADTGIVRYSDDGEKAKKGEWTASSG